MEIGRRAFGKIENRTAYVLLIAFLKNESRILSQQHLMKRYTRENIAVLSEYQLIIDNKAILNIIHCSLIHLMMRRF